MAGQSGWQNTVEHVDSKGDCLDDAHRITDTHEVSGLISGQYGGGGSQRWEHLFAALPHRESTDAVTVEVHLNSAVRTFGAKRGIDATLNNAELGLGGPSSPCRRIGCFGSRRPQRRAFNGVTYN
jgi:hypothetical protein